MPKALNIQKKDPKIPSRWLFKELREKGIEYISTFSGELWTDHNLHDPGITILEALCYAISDLGYRTKLDVKDLLALETGKEEDNFLTPEQILTCNPLTILDYRKMLVDIPGVRNAWLVPSDEQEVSLYINCDKDLLQFSPTENKKEEIGELVLNGLYKVYLDVDPVLISTTGSSCEDKSSPIDAVLKNVKKRLHQHRNLCEDFFDIIVLQDEQIGVCGDIELEPNANPDEVLEAIYEAIENELSPRLDFFSLKEMIEKKKSLEEIFEGRPYTRAYEGQNGKYSHGFIDTTELEKSVLPERLLASDYYRVIMSVAGVRAIKSLLLRTHKDDVENLQGEEWVLDLTKNHRPIFSPEGSNFNFSKGVIRVSASTKRAIDRFKKRLHDFRKNKFHFSELDLTIPYGNYRSDLADYKSIQHEFPLVYGIGEGHLSDEVSEERKVQALQLKSYLTFFDQLLAGYLSQLSNVRQLFSWKLPNDSEAGNLGQTYFQQELVDIPKAEKIFLSYEQSGQAAEWKEGDVMAMPLQPFSHPTDRDMAIIQLVELFNNFSEENGKSIIEVEEEEKEVYRFIVTGSNGVPVLKSKPTYNKEADAFRAAQILFFQGTLTQSYEHVNWPEFSEYSFAFVYKPVNYTDYLKSITESESSFYQRKDNFLNHLLARFGEQFTEYVLLMYALNQNVPDPKNIIQDKARFLENYPDISRNRGRGFDYTRKDNIWNSKENISGFEKRVAGLMGLANWERRYLNNFDVVIREQKYLLTIKDHRGTVLFETTDCFTKEEIESDELKDKFADLLCGEEDFEAFDNIDCINENVYGLRLCEPNGKVFANYSRTFGNKTDRDKMLNCIKNYFNTKATLIAPPEIIASDNDPDLDVFLGQIVNIVAEDKGFYFLLTSEEGQEILMKSSNAYHTKEEACHAWVEFVKRAKINDNYRLVDGKSFEGGPLSFVIDTDDDGKEEFGFHPKGYSNEPVRNDKKNIIWKSIDDKKLDYEICRRSDLYSWSLLEEDKNTLLDSAHKFKTEEQARDAWNRFRVYGVHSTNYLQKDTEKGFSFTVFKNALNTETEEEEKIIVACSPVFDSAKKRNEAQAVALEKIQKDITSKTASDIQINTITGLFYFVVKNTKTNATLFIGAQPSETEKEAECSYYKFVELASDKINYKEITQEGTCLLSFKVVEKKKDKDNPEKEVETDLGFHPEFYVKEEKNVIQPEVISFIKKNKIPFKIELLPGAYHFEIGWESCEGLCETLLIEKGNHTDKTQAQNEALEMLINYDPGEPPLPGERDDYLDLGDPDQWALIEKEEGYSFALKKGNHILANHSRFYTSKAKRDRVLEDVKKYLRKYKSLFDFSDDKIEQGDKVTFFDNSIEEIPKWESCGISCEEEQDDEACLLSGFRLCKTDESLAYHPIDFYEEQEQNKVLNELLEKAQCDQLYYSEICLQGSKISIKIDNKYHYEIWEQNPSMLLWRSTESFNSAEDAETAFQENWLKIIELARNTRNYKLPNENNSYLSLFKEDTCIAYCPESSESETETYEKKAYLIKTAKRYPLYSLNKNFQIRTFDEDCKEVMEKENEAAPITDGKFHFRIYNEDCTKILWKSSRGYPTTTEAMQAFAFFFSLLKKQTNYRRNNDKQACILKIEIGETLLEGNRTYANVLPVIKAVFDDDFATEDAAREQIGMLYKSLNKLSIDEIVEEGRTAIEKNKFKYTFNETLEYVNEEDDPISVHHNWVSDVAYDSEAEAIARFRNFLELGATLANYSIKAVKIDDEKRFTIVVNNKWAACPAVFEKGEIKVGGLSVLVSEDCEEYKEADCVQTICPAAWDEGLQSFLIHAIREEDYYTFADYQADCKLGFRVVTDKYRIARNLEEFSLPAHQTQYKDWVYGYSRCEKEVSSELPGVKIFKKNGLYHYYTQGESDKVVWCGSVESNTNTAASNLFNSDYKDLFSFARFEENYILPDEPEPDPFRIALKGCPKDGEIVLVALSDTIYESVEEAKKAIQCTMIYAQTIYAYLLDDDKNKPTVDIKPTEDGKFIYCISIPELIWKSYQGYDDETKAIAAFNDQLYDFYAYAQEIDFYELGREETPEGGRPLHLLKEDCSILALSFHTYKSNGEGKDKKEWNAAVLHRILMARKFPYFKYNNKFGFQCFSLENAPKSELGERTDCDPPAPESPEISDCKEDCEGKICQDIPGGVIWESVFDYNTFEEVKCAFDNFQELLKDKQNYQSRQLEDCNLFGLEITHPNEVLATHPQRYFTKTSLDEAIERTRDCINAEGFHLIEHILLRPKQGISNHITIQFNGYGELNCIPKDLKAIINYKKVVEGITYTYTYYFDPLKPWVFLRGSFENLPVDESLESSVINFIKTTLDQSTDANGVFDQTLFKQALTDNSAQYHLVEECIEAFANAFAETSGETDNWNNVEFNEVDTRDRSPMTLAQDVFMDEAEAKKQKDCLIANLKNLIDSDSGLTVDNVGIALSRIETETKKEKITFIPENLASFAQVFLNKIKEIDIDALSEENPIPEGFLDTLIFCFNKTTGTTSDKLIPICPDCDHVEHLPETEASEAACSDPKLALAESTLNEDSESDLGGTYYVPGADPYSFWTTIVLPYWPERFQNSNFRNFFEDTLRREAPAHLGLRICWLDPKQMRAFERAYREWLEAFSGNENCNLQDAQHRLVCILFDEEDGISNVYPPARLQEGGCELKGTSDPGAVLLDFTQLG